MLRSHLRQLPIGLEIVYYFLLVLIFVFAIYLRLCLPSIPFLDCDSWDYLWPALESIIKGPASPTYREFLYPCLIKNILWLWPDFRAITFAKHTCGVLSAILLLVTWHRIRAFLPEGIITNIFHRLGGLIVITLYLFAVIIVLDEHKIRPEAFFVFTVALYLWLVAEFSIKVFLDKNFGILEALIGMLLIFLSSAAYYLRPYYGFAVPCSLLPLLIAFIWTPNNWLLKIGSTACGIALVFSLLVWPDYHVHALQVCGKKYFLSESLFCASSEILYELVSKDAHALPVNDPKGSIIRRFLEALNKVKGHPSKNYASFKRFDPDDVRYLGPTAQLKKDLGGDEQKIRDFFYGYYLRGWKEYPFRMIKKVAIELWFFYSPRWYRTYDHEKFVNTSHELQRSNTILADNISYDWPPFQKYTRQVRLLKDQAHIVDIPRMAQFVVHPMNTLYFLSLILTIIAAIALQCGWLKEKGRPFKKASLWALYLFLYNFGMSFTIAFVFVMGQRRYTFGQVLFSALSECFALVFLILLALVSIQQLQKNYCEKKLVKGV